jgi:hypothetical protein
MKPLHRPKLEGQLKHVVSVMLFVIYFATLYFFAASITGAGHGTTFFLELCFCPISLIFDLSAPADSISMIALIGFWPAFGLCLALRRFSGFRIAAFLSLIAHEGSVPILIFKELMSERGSNVGRAWSAVPLWVLVFLGVYLVGQVWFWVLALSPVPAKFTDETEQQLPFGGQV